MASNVDKDNSGRRSGIASRRGLPRWQQRSMHRIGIAILLLGALLPGTFLCSCASYLPQVESPEIGCQYRWLNVTNAKKLVAKEEGTQWLPDPNDFRDFWAAVGDAKERARRRAPRGHEEQFESATERLLLDALRHKEVVATDDFFVDACLQSTGDGRWLNDSTRHQLRRIQFCDIEKVMIAPDEGRGLGFFWWLGVPLVGPRSGPHALRVKLRPGTQPTPPVSDYRDSAQGLCVQDGEPFGNPFPGWIIRPKGDYQRDALYMFGQALRFLAERARGQRREAP